MQAALFGTVWKSDMYVATPFEVENKVASESVKWVAGQEPSDTLYILNACYTRTPGQYCCLS